MKKAWTDEQAERRLKGWPSAEQEDRADRKNQGPISDDEALSILQGRRPKKIVREGRSEKSSRDPLVKAIDNINFQIVDILEAERRRQQVFEVIRGHPAP